MVGLAVVGTAHSFGQAVAGMSISGAGAGIGELTALGGYILKSTIEFKANNHTGLPSSYLLSIADSTWEGSLHS